MTDFNHVEELEKAALAVGIMIFRCESMLEKFAEGTSQHTLLLNRINALEISRVLIAGKLEEGTESETGKTQCPYTNEELTKALPPVLSIIHKCEKAQAKHEKGSSQYRRYQRMTEPMQLAKDMIEEWLRRFSETDKRVNS